jgi:hypothetical protein
MLPRPLRLSLAALIVVFAPALLTSAQTATPVPDAPPAMAAPVNLPPIVNASVTPRRVVYLDSMPTAGAQVMVDATKSEDPEGQPLTYAHDVNGDGVFTPWFFRAEVAEPVTMPGPFVATARVRDPLGAVGEQQVHMLARQFSRSYIRSTWNTSMPAFGLVGGLPAFVYEDYDKNLVLTGNDLADGRGRWTTVTVKPVNAMQEWLGISDYKWGTSCQLTDIWGVALLCDFRMEKDGSYMLRYLVTADPWSGKWTDLEVVKVRGEPAPTLGTIAYLPAVLYFNNNSLALLVGNWSAESGAVMVGGGFELIWSEDVGAAPPATHSAVVGVGDDFALPAFVYLNAAKPQLIYAVNQQADGRGKWDYIPIEGQTGDIGRPSLAMIAGRPTIAYRDGRKGHLKLAVNDRADGRGKWQVTVVYPGTADGPRTQSLAAIDGRAGIAFEDAARGLLFAYDPGVQTGNYWPVAVVDHRGNPALRRDPVLIAIDGSPAIGYGPFSIQFAAAR